MSASRPRFVLRPRSFNEVIDLSFVFLRLHPGPFLLLLPWVLVPELLLLAVPAGAEMEGWVLAETIALAIVATPFSGIYTRLCGALLLQPGVDLRALQQRFLRDLPQWMVWRILGQLVALVTFGVAYSRVALQPETALLEQSPWPAGLRRSRTLLAHAPGRWLAFLVATVGTWFLFGEGLHLVVSAVSSLFGFAREAASENVAIACRLVGHALARVFMSTLEFLLYVDCRTRAEGWDLQVEVTLLVAQDRERPARVAA